PLKESFAGFAGIAEEVPVADNMKVMRAVTTGGSTALYFGVTKLPDLNTFAKKDIDLYNELEEAKKEIPLDTLPNNLMAEQSKRLQESASDLGYTFKKNLMLIDQKKCGTGYSYDAKWKAKSWVYEAKKNGANLVNRASVNKILLERDRAVGVEYFDGVRKNGTRIRHVYGKKVIISAGSLATPIILRNSGITDIADRGFYCKPGIVMFGTVPGMKGEDSFLGSMSAEIDEGLELGDGNMSAMLFKMLMLSIFKPHELFSHSKTITVGLTLDDEMSGEIKENGRYYKTLTERELKKIHDGEEVAARMLRKAGAKKIFKGNITAGNPSGVIRIGDHINSNLETKFHNLHICDASVLSEDMRVTPTLTLICLAKYLAGHVAKTI
ncbi:MAG: GMC family oxidoreductase, partial [Chitinivibrionales bacterium]|nr:GMC family oxidoreductase [Chitinivibrionales bacterium]